MTDVVSSAALQIAEDLATLLVGAEESRHGAAAGQTLLRQRSEYAGRICCH
jgi:hypothetical protein